MTTILRARRFLKRFKENRVGLAYIWAAAILTIVFTPLIVWPLNTALLTLEENLNYTFTGIDAFALQVINICTGYILFFVLIAVLFKSLIASKAENTNAY